MYVKSIQEELKFVTVPMSKNLSKYFTNLDINKHSTNHLTRVHSRGYVPSAAVAIYCGMPAWETVCLRGVSAQGVSAQWGMSAQWGVSPWGCPGVFTQEDVCLRGRCLHRGVCQGEGCLPRGGGVCPGGVCPMGDVSLVVSAQ